MINQTRSGLIRHRERSMLSFPHQERKSSLSLVIPLTEGLEAQEAS
jgi:hypothetical protein